ncbi:hypothetical protein pb186bvf_013385 [Paramecium bursaria]
MGVSINVQAISYALFFINLIILNILSWMNLFRRYIFTFGDCSYNLQGEIQGASNEFDTLCQLQQGLCSKSSMIHYFFITNVYAQTCLQFIVIVALSYIFCSKSMEGRLRLLSYKKLIFNGSTFLTFLFAGFDLGSSNLARSLEQYKVTVDSQLFGVLFILGCMNFLEILFALGFRQNYFMVLEQCQQAIAQELEELNKSKSIVSKSLQLVQCVGSNGQDFVIVESNGQQIYIPVNVGKENKNVQNFEVYV